MTEIVVPNALKDLEAIWEQPNSEASIESSLVKDPMTVRDIATILDGFFVPTSYVRIMRAEIKDAERFGPTSFSDNCESYALATGLEAIRLTAYIYSKEIVEYIAGFIQEVGSML